VFLYGAGPTGSSTSHGMVSLGLLEVQTLRVLHAAGYVWNLKSTGIITVASPSLFHKVYKIKFTILKLLKNIICLLQTFILEIRGLNSGFVYSIRKFYHFPQSLQSNPVIASVEKYSFRCCSA
jgi:hypothetical protein